MFGMGTGGSLRLLSPEIGQGPIPFAAAFLLTSDRPSNRLPTSLERLSLRKFLPSAPAPGFAPSKPHRLDRFAPPTWIRSLNPHILLPHNLLPGLRFSFVALRFHSRFSCSLFPFPFSLFQDQALDRVVSPSSIRYRTSTDDLSTLSSSRGLTCS